jgi:uncharacterized protein (TIGR03086 family)
MSDVSSRYRKVADQFGARVDAVPPGAWDNPTPCEGWVARDIVGHMAEWMPSLFLASVGAPLPVLPDVDSDPAGAWRALDAALQAALDDPDVASRQVDTPVGTFSVAEAIARFGLPDVLVHTWDLARATGLDDTLDPVEVRSLAESLADVGDSLEKSGHYGPRVPVPDGADEQTKVLALMGRRA